MTLDETPVETFKFNTPEGFVLCRRILADTLPHDPHEYQLEGACNALDGLDVLVVTPTGSGKTGILIMYMHIILAINKQPTLCPTVKFRADPAMLVVCPTKSLELDMEPKFAKAGLPSTVINRDTVEQARLNGHSLWDAAASRTTRVVLLSPEQLSSKDFEALLQDKRFAPRIQAMAVDEAHLLNLWGAGFRPMFKQIGHARIRLPGAPVVIALTATLRPGGPTESVCQFLGFKKGSFSLVRRSNSRYDIQIIFRTMKSGARAHQFSELDWVLQGDRRVILFCSTIALGYRISTYLLHKAQGMPDCQDRIRMYNSLNWPSYNSETLRLMLEDARSRVTIATDALAQGIDVANTDDVIVYGQPPKDLDMALQMGGRIRDGRQRSSRMIFYFPRNIRDVAQKVLDAEPEGRNGASIKRGHTEITLNISMARFILATCQVEEIDRQYGNTQDGPLCTCQGCRSMPRAQRPLPCNCSGCLLEKDDATQVLFMANLNEPVSKSRKKLVTKKMQEHGLSQFQTFRLQLWEDADDCELGMYPLDLFLPEDIIKRLIEILNNPNPQIEDVLPVIASHPLLTNYQREIWEVLQGLQIEFTKMRDEARLAVNAKRRETIRKRKEAGEMQTLPEVAGAQEESSSDSDHNSSDPEGKPPPKLYIRIPPVSHNP